MAYECKLPMLFLEQLGRWPAQIARLASIFYVDI